MEKTMGKRIAANRKRLGLTQDKLAEQLGVTAQAVSKWENDQACPDITTLPKLAAIFGITTDELLGIPRAEVHQAEVVEEAPEASGIHINNDKWEIHWDSGKKNHIGFAVWVLLTGVLLLLSKLQNWDVTLWEIAWPSALLIFGLLGLYPKLSFFRIGCGLFGLYYLLEHLHVPMFNMGSDLLLPVLILLFGVSLLADAFRKNRKPAFHVTKKGGSSKFKSECYNAEDRFECDVSFGEHTHSVDVPLLRGGEANLSFGELTVDLRSCREIVDGCAIEANCSFGELTLLVPRCYAVRNINSSAFGSVDIDGEPDANPLGIIYLDANVSFGEICVEYV